MLDNHVAWFMSPLCFIVYSFRGNVLNVWFADEVIIVSSEEQNLLMATRVAYGKNTNDLVVKYITS